MGPRRFPGETDEYRRARDELLAAELKLRRQAEEVATRRRRLPLGGAVPEDYVFEESGGHVRMSALFGDHDTLVLYSFMYGPDMALPCAMCTSLLDGLDGAVPDITQRVGFAVVARSPAPRIDAFAASHGWRNLRVLSSACNTYNRDYHAEGADGNQTSTLNVFVRRDGTTRHFYATELRADPGQDDRHVDMLWPLWNVLDLTPGGRGSWRPVPPGTVVPGSPPPSGNA